MGGKTGTSTASTTIPSEVLARYNSVNKQAQDTAGQEFKQYSPDASAFVAPLNEQQQAATAQTNQYANAAQPSIGYAQQGYTPEGYQQGVQGYMNPFLSNAMGATAAQMNNVNQQQQQEMIGSAIGKGAFGGDRANIGLGALQNQQNLAMGQTLGNMASQGYQNAAQNYMTGLGQIGNLGIQGQQAGLQGAQAMMGAGTLGQQTTQAGKSALYNQFQQQQAYPFQVAQFLANIAEGTGALSGSTTTQTSPQSFFSDVRLKEDIKRVGTAKNGLPIYTFKYKGDHAEQTHIGYMAQDVEKVHPEAVGESHGFKTVDYNKASEPAHRALGGANFNPAANLMTGEGDQASQDSATLPPVKGGIVPSVNAGEHDHEPHGDFGFTNMGGQQASERSNGAWARGGVIPNHEGGAVMPHHMGQGFAVGGDVISPTDMGALIAQQQQSFSPHGQAGMYGSSSQMTPGGKSFVPAANMHVAKLQAPQVSNVEGETLMGDIDRAENIGNRLTKMQNYAAKVVGQPAKAATNTTAAQPATGVQGAYDWAKQYFPTGQAHGGVVGYASGGSTGPYATDDPMSQVVGDTEKDKDRQLMKSSIANPKGNGTFGDLMSLAALPSEISTIGSGIGSVMTALAPIGLATGGRAGFEDGGDATPDDIMGKYAPAIANIESSGNYAARGPVTKTGDRAFGKYQVMGANVPSWTKEATGREMTPDEFIASPEAQDATFKHHFGKALAQYGNPQDAASVWFSGKPQAAAGNASDITGTTVPSYLKKFNENIGAADLPAKGAAPAEVMVNGRQGFQAPEGDQQQPSALKGIGDALSNNEHLLIPLLSGIGAMAGSKSRYLGSAILEGIGAGAGAYENVQNNIMQRQLDQPIAAQRNMATANALQAGLIDYNANRAHAKLPPVSLEEYARVTGYKGALPEGSGATTQPSGQGYSYTVPEMNSLVINRNGANIPAMSDQGYLRAFISENAGVQTPYVKSAVESAQHNLDQIVANQKTQNAAGETINAPGAIGTGQQTALAAQRMASSGDFVNQAIAFNKVAPNIKQNLSDLEDVYSQFRSGANTARNSFQQLMSAIDPDGNYPSLHNADASNYQSALKGAASLMTAQLAGMPAGAPKAELEVLQRQIAAPNLEPDAVHHIISRAKASVDYQDNLNRGYNPEKENFDVQGYQDRYRNGNDYEKFVNQTESSMKPGKGTTGTITPEPGKVYQDANGNKARWDGSKYIKVQ